MVTRHSANGFMPISEDGRWVTHADYRALEEELAALRVRVGELVRTSAAFHVAWADAGRDPTDEEMNEHYEALKPFDTELGEPGLDHATIPQSADDLEDAERYRWLRDERTPALVQIRDEHLNGTFIGAALDRAIDTARTPKEQTK